MRPCYQRDLFGYDPNNLGALQGLADRVFDAAVRRYWVGATRNHAVRLDIPHDDQTAEAMGHPSRVAAEAVAVNVAQRLCAAGVPALITEGA